MTRDDIIRMAREAGFVVDELSQQHQPNCIFHTWHLIDEGLERFASLVAAAEREACAKVCLDIGLACEVRQGADLCFELSEVIRARSKYE